MREVKVAQLCQRLVKAPSGPLIGLDVGTRYIGVAISDAEYRIAHPHSVVDVKGGPVGYASNVLGTLVRELSSPGLVIGYPLRLTGFQGQQGPLVEQFVRELQRSEMLKDSCFVYWDERLTSRTVEGAISFLKLEPRRRKQIVDKLAALCILQSCLDNMTRNKERHLLANENDEILFPFKDLQIQLENVTTWKIMGFLHKQSKNAVIRLNTNGYVKLLFLLSLVYQAAAQIGKGAPIAIRIACGSSESSQSPKGNLWLKDFGFTGGKTAKYNGKNELAPQSSTLRYFDMSDGPENCYNVTTQNGHYLLRFFFAYGNVDNADLEPQFDVSIEGTLVYTLNRQGWSNDRSISYADSLVYVEDGAATVCLHSSGHGNPSIASLELLQVYDTAYELEHPWSHHVILKLVKRVNCGGNFTGYEVRFSGNVWGGDRYWESDGIMEKGITSSVNTTKNIKMVNAAPNFYPEFIYQTASTANTGVSVSYNIQVEPNQNYTLWFHFAEITTAIAAKEQRVLDILVNNRLIFADVDILALTGQKFTAVTLNKTVFVQGKMLVITFRPVQGSILVNAFEVYQVIRTEYTTDKKEVWALQALKHSFALPARVGWNGDPCIPQEHPWSGISCGFAGGWFMDGLDLDNQGLKGYIAKDISYLTNLRSINISSNSLYGPIPPEIGNLTNLSILDLSYNNLNGSIPASFGNLPRLRKLYLNGNHLSGAVPTILLSGPIRGASFNFTDNLGLCGIPGLKPCGFTLSVGAKVGIGFGIFLAIAIGGLCGFCYWKRRVNISRSQRLTTTRSSAFAKSKTKFSKDLQLSRIHRVDDLDSPYKDQDNGSLI